MCVCVYVEAGVPRGNPGYQTEKPSCCEATLLTSAPPCCPGLKPCRGRWRSYFFCPQREHATHFCRRLPRICRDWQPDAAPPPHNSPSLSQTSAPDNELHRRRLPPLTPHSTSFALRARGYLPLCQPDRCPINADVKVCGGCGPVGGRVGLNHCVINGVWLRGDGGGGLGGHANIYNWPASPCKQEWRYKRGRLNN